MDRWRSRASADDGGITVWVVIVAMAFFLVTGLVVDGGGRVRAMQRANTVAQEAARAAGQAIVAPDAVRGERVVAAPMAARNAARKALEHANMEGTVDITNGGTKIEIDTRDRYRTVFLSAVGLGQLDVDGHATVSLISKVEN